MIRHHEPVVSSLYHSAKIHLQRFRPRAHSDFIAGASNADNSRADRLLLIGSPSQGVPGQNPFHTSPVGVIFHPMNHATSNPTEVLETSLNTLRW